jgi:hypothetical protein
MVASYLVTSSRTTLNEIAIVAHVLHAAFSSGGSKGSPRGGLTGICLGPRKLLAFLLQPERQDAGSMREAEGPHTLLRSGKYHGHER